ncbi:MAG: hypothetical protein GC185_03555 [Alphaproteobacteria bacterium]|nr:hypothetical protein [Alphaproteobacteria bacterium]
MSLGDFYGHALELTVMMFRKKTSAGFTLIETAIVITIASLLTVGFLHLYLAVMQRQRIETTKHRLDALRLALTDYVALHNRLPCPASPDSDAVDDGSACAPGAGNLAKDVVAAIYDKDFMGRDEKREIWIGAVPVRALRLSGEDGRDGRDGWGDKFTYAVSRRLTLPQAMRATPVPLGIIRVTDGKGRSAIEPPASARYVIVSHGPSGLGAWTRSGIRRPCPAGTLASVNCLDTGAFVDASFSTARGAGFFDDFVIYDGQNARGSLLNRLATCNLEKAFYDPSDARADADGCVKPEQKGLWHGACLETSASAGGNSYSQTAAVMEPAVQTGKGCGCEKGYELTEIGTWSGGAPPGACKPSGAFTNAKTGEVLDCSKVVPLGNIPKNASIDSTTLYTCTKNE